MSLPLQTFQYQPDWTENAITQPFTPFFVKTRRRASDCQSTYSQEKKTYCFKQPRDDVLTSFDFADADLNKRHVHESPNINNERVYYMETDYSFKLVVPYSHYMKTKKLFYSPFSWTYDHDLANKVSQHSFYMMKEVPHYEFGCKTEDRRYQVQLDRDKIDRIRDQIEIAFECYSKLIFCNKIRVDPSVEISKLKRLLRAISTQTEAERKFDYGLEGQKLLVAPTLHNDVYAQYEHILGPIIQDKCIPLLVALHKELYHMGYLDEQYTKLKEGLEFMGQDINQTITVLTNLKKKAESATHLSWFTEKDLKRIDRVKKPHQLYSYFLDLAIKMKALYNEARAPSRLKYILQKYIKTIVILEVYKGCEENLKAWKHKLLLQYKQLQRKVGSSKSDIKEFVKKKQACLSESDISIESPKIDIKKFIEEEYIDKLTILDMKEQISNIGAYVIKVQKICQGLSKEKDERKIYKIYSETANYIEQVDQLIQGIACARDDYEKISRKIENDAFEEKTAETLEKEASQEFEHLSAQIKNSYCAFSLDSWDHSKLNGCLDMVIAKFLKTNKKVKGKGKEKGKEKEKEKENTIPFEQKKIMEKLAQIIRERKKQKNKLFVSSKARVGSGLNICDIIELFKSKKLWQAIVSGEAQLISIKGWVQDEYKSVNHKIYCNPELEIYLVKIIKYFVNSLSDSVFGK